MDLTRIFAWEKGRPILKTVPGAPPAIRPGRSRAASPAGALPPRAVRPDPSVMYLSRPYASVAYEPLHPVLASIAECMGPRSTRLDDRWGVLAAWIGADELEYARRLCRRLNRKAWRTVLLLFCDALLRSQFDRAPRWKRRDAALSRDWSKAPWLYLDPRRSGRASLEEIDLNAVRRLGFVNIALLSNVGSDIVAGGTSRLGAFVRSASDHGLRVAVGVDFSVFAQPLDWWAPPDLADPQMLVRIFRTLGHEANLGILGTRTHGIDHWFDAQHAEQTHALHGLMKLFLKKLTARDVVIPEISATSDLVSFVGGGVSVCGEKTTTEGDLVHWRAGMRGLRTSLLDRDKSAVEQALLDRPRLLYGAALTCSLEHHDDIDRDGINGLLEHDPRRIALAYQMLYAIGATPIVYAPSAGAAPAPGLRSLNRHFDRAFVPHAHRAPRDVCVWRHDKRWFLANLANRWVDVPAASDRPAKRLPPYGFAWITASDNDVAIASPTRC